MSEFSKKIVDEHTRQQNKAKEKIQHETKELMGERAQRSAYNWVTSQKIKTYHGFSRDPEHYNRVFGKNRK